MDNNLLKNLLEQVKRGDLGIDEALDRLKRLPFEDVGFASIDHHRSLRQGFPECIWGEGKTAEQIIAIAQRMTDMGQPVIATRVDKAKAQIVCNALADMEYHATARMLTLTPEEIRIAGKGLVMVISAGTADLPVAEEAALTARMLGNEVETMYDVGVAGIHRLVSRFDRLEKARVFVVVAGMEGALPSVVGGLVSKPVIAVPTSVGYGSHFGGIAALLGMLNSCASGVSVVNIDNGFGAGCVANLINRL
jgi:NCAIR mutase (PurE)-related protein